MLRDIEHEYEQTGRSYCALAKRYGLPLSRLMRWRANVHDGYPPIRQPGPKKQPLSDTTLLDQQVDALPCGPKRTKGTTVLYDSWRNFISRRGMNQRVAEKRRTRHRLEREQLQYLCWWHPGTVWAMDEAEMDGWRWLLVVDLASRYRFELLLADRLPATCVVAHLEMLFRSHKPPLALKHDNGPNFANEVVAGFLTEEGVRRLLSPYYWPRYNGAVEYAQREIKLVAKILHEEHGMPLDEALVMAPKILNAKPRPCLNGATANEVFHTPNPALSWAFTKESRKDTTRWIDERKETILATMLVNNRHTQDAAKRLATETWMLNLGLVSRVQSKIVSPHFR
jgi:hypothetical protein